MIDPMLSIVVAEDDPAHAEAIRRALLEAEFPNRLTLAESIGTYRAAVNAAPPDIALLDLNLPDGNALEVLNAPPESARFPVLIMTSYGDEQIAVEAMKAGALDYIVKSAETFQNVPHVIQRALREWSLLIDRKRAEDALRRSEARIRAIYNHLPNATFVWKHRAGTFYLTAFNSAALSLTEDGIAAFQERPLPDLPLGFPEVSDDLHQCFRNCIPIKKTLTYERPDTKTPIQLRATYGFVPPDMVLLHAEDITAQLQTEAQLRAAQRMEAVGRLAGGIAHDFNNLLSIILNCTQFALDATPAENQATHRDLLSIYTAGERAADLTRQLLAFSRNQLIQPRNLDLNRLITQMSDMLIRLLGEDIAIEFNLDRSGAPIKADSGQIEQVIMNLAVNARDAMPDGGVLRIETAPVSAAEIRSSFPLEFEYDKYIRLSVSDTGMGMDEKTRSRAFEPFFTTKEIGKGTGLGLATVYGIVRQMDGRIWVNSVPSRGSEFEIYFPQAQEMTNRENQPSAVIVRATGNETILIVEDETDVRELSERILRAAGYKTLTAADGEEALRISAKCKTSIDLLLTDMIMPKMSGRMLAARLKAVRPKTKVLFMTGYAGTTEAGGGTPAPGAGLIKKPFNSAALTETIRSVLDAPAEIGGARGVE